jgi:hypothetical protein
MQKSQLGFALKFLGSRHTQKSAFCCNIHENFHYRTLPRIFDVRLKFACALITCFPRISRNCAYARFFNVFEKYSSHISWQFFITTFGFRFGNKFHEIKIKKFFKFTELKILLSNFKYVILIFINFY